MSICKNFTTKHCFFAFLMLLLPLCNALAQFSIATESLNYDNIQSGTGYGSGISFYDFNGDGWDDLSTGSGTGELQFFINNNGTLESIDLGITNSVAADITMILWADYDNDGDADLLITRHYFSPQLWRNNGDLQFQNISAEAGLEQDFTNYWGAAFCDYDHDGCLDLFLAKYHFNSSPFSNQKSVLYRNDCNGGFIDVTTEAGIVFPARPSFQPVFADFNHDGWEDLYIIIDKSDYPNELFINNTDGTFNQVTESSGAGIMISAMTGTIGDYDNDGDLDVFVSNDPVPHNILLQNNGIAEFSDVTGSAGLIENPVYPSWGGLWIDYDNDTWQDLFYGTVTSPQSPPTGNRFFVNHFPDIFSDQSQLLGIHDEMTESFVCAKGDVNNDGYYDFYTNNQAPYPSQLYLNNGGENNYLAVSLQGTYSNPDGIGSWIHCFVNGEKFVRFTTCGENFVGQDSKRQIFGLGNASLVDSLVVYWNRGTRDVRYFPDINQTITIVEGESNSEPFPIGFSDTLYLCPNDTLELDAGIYSSYLWNTGDTTKLLAVSELGTYQVTVINQFGFSVESFPVEVVDAPESEVIAFVDDVDCFGADNGSVWLESTINELDSVVWSNGFSLPFIEDLEPGEYWYVAKDDYGCQYSDTITITEPDSLTSTIETTPVVCYGEASGAAVINYQGGTPPYNTFWEGMNPNAIAAGEYSIVYNDWNFCSDTIFFSIHQPDSIHLQLAVENQSEDGPGGSAEIQIYGGIPPYEIIWSNGILDSIYISELTAGSYSVLVYDANNCEKQRNFEVDYISNLNEHSRENAYKIFPNPSTGNFRIDCSEITPVKTELIDKNGKIVWSREKYNCNSEISVAHLSDAVYLLRITDEQLSYHYRLALIR